MKTPGRREVGKSGIFIYIESIISLASGYILWLILSKIVSSDIIGVASTAISISSVIITVVTLGIPNSISRFLGKSYVQGRINWAKLYIMTSIVIVTTAVALVCIVSILIMDTWLFRSLGPELIIVTLIFTCASAIALVLRYSVIASLQTKSLILRESIYSSAKILVSVILVTLGLGSLGITIGYAISQILAVLLLGLVVSRIYKSSKDDTDKVQFRSKIRSVSIDVLRAGFPSWIPALISTTGSQLGTIVVFASQGAHNAGAYFISLSISNGIASLTYSLLSSTFPALSAMSDGRKDFAWQLTKISLIITVPLSMSLLFYTDEILSLFGESYVAGSSSLKILLMSLLPTTVMTGINILVYAYGDYKKVLMIGLATSLPRTFLYFILVPFYGIEGSAISFSVGSLVGFIAAAIVARRIEMHLFWKDLVLVCVLPLTIGFILYAFQVFSIIAILLDVIITYILLLKFGIINLVDVQNLIMIMPPGVSRPVITIFKQIRERINRRC